MHMFAGMALAAILVLLVIFLFLYPLLRKLLPDSFAIAVDGIIVILLAAIGIALMATGTVHLILMGVFSIGFGLFVLSFVRKGRVAKMNKRALKEYVGCSRCGKQYHRTAASCPYC